MGLCIPALSAFRTLVRYGAVLGTVAFGMTGAPSLGQRALQSWSEALPNRVL